MRVIYEAFFLNQNCPAVLPKVVARQHVTTEYKPEVTHEHLYGQKASFKIVAYANDGMNEGYKVELVSCDSEELRHIYEAIEVPHITLATSQGARPFNTRNLDFFPVNPGEDKVVDTVYGGFVNNKLEKEKKDDKPVRKFVTKNGRVIGVPSWTMEHLEAHSDVDFDLVEEAIKEVDYVGDFYIGSVDLGRIIGQTSCVEVGPEDKVEYFYRKKRAGMTPFVRGREKTDTSRIVICLKQIPGKNKWTGEHFKRDVLITTFYGDVAPMEPWDARRKDCSEEEIKRCDDFWSTHALIYDENEIDFDRKE